MENDVMALYLRKNMNYLKVILVNHIMKLGCAVLIYVHLMLEDKVLCIVTLKHYKKYMNL